MNAKTKRQRQGFMLIVALLISNLFILSAHAASFVANGANLDLNLEASESVTIVANATNYTFTLDGAAIWNGTDDANVIGNGTNTLTVTADAFTNINMNDSGAGTAVTLGNSGVNTFSDNINITLNAGNNTVTIANATSFSDGTLAASANSIIITGAVTTANTDISLFGDVIDIQAAVSAGAGIVTLAPLSASRLVDLGSITDVAVNTLELSDTEIDWITASVLRIGRANAGSINFTKTISPLGTDTLSLITGDKITDGNSGADVQVTNLAIQAVNGIADSGSTLLDTNTTTLAALNTTSGAISVLEHSSGGDLTVGTVDGVVGVTNLANTGSAPTLSVQIETNNGNLTINSDIFNQRRNIFLVAQQGNGSSGDRLFTNNANISTAAANGQIRIDANNMSLAGGTISAPSKVTLQDDPSSSAIVPINLGGADGVNTLGLTSAELDTVATAGILQIGHSGTGNLDVTAPIDLTDGPSIPTTDLISGAAILGSSGNVLTVNTLNLTAVTTIGTNGDPFAFNATRVTTLSSGDQILEECDTVTIDSNDLNAGASNNIRLTGGTFILTNDGEIQSNVLLETDTILAGIGTVNGTVSVLDSSSVTPGNSPGIITTGDLTFAAGAHFNVEVNGITTAGVEYDQLNVNGSVSIDPAAMLNLTGTVSAATLYDTVVLINNDGVEAVSGNFAGLPDNTLVTINGQNFRIFYNGGDGNDVVLRVTLDIACPTLFPASVADETLLNGAIECYNMMTVPGVYTLTLAADISLVTATSPINNSTSGVSLNIVGNGHTVDGQGIVGVRPFAIQPDTTVHMNNLTITGGNVDSLEYGGGILNAGNLTLQKVNIMGNAASAGGGVHNTGTLTLHNSTVMGNTAVSGGGIGNYGGTLLVNQSTINNNTATSSFGGGIQTVLSGVLTIENSTISGNQAGWNGGGIGTSSDHLVSINNSTITNNVADFDNGGLVGDGGGISAFSTTVITLTNSIIADNIDVSGGAPDCVELSGGTITSQGYNIIGDTTGCTLSTQTSDILNQAPLLDSLADNGGDTQTHALLAGSPAFNAIPSGTNGCGTTVTTDQRGVIRPTGGGGCDSGAYESEAFSLTVSVAGNGSGSVSGPGISCPGDCSEIYVENSVVTLTVVADIGSTFAGWSGGCAGTGDCVVTMDQAHTVTATFTRDQVDLTISLAGDGSGSVNGPGINCPGDCGETFDYGTVVTLTAVADTGFFFAGWSGDVVSAENPIAVTMDSDKDITATFMTEPPVTYTLTTAVVGQGSVVPDSGVYISGTVLSLTAVPETGWQFVDWSGDLSGSQNPQVLTMDSNKFVTATFMLETAVTYPLTVTVAGTGQGTVTSYPLGIACEPDCAAVYEAGTVVTLTASPEVGSIFAGWQGACSGTGECVVTMDEAITVTAVFNSDQTPASYQLYLPFVTKP